MIRFFYFILLLTLFFGCNKNNESIINKNISKQKFEKISDRIHISIQNDEARNSLILQVSFSDEYLKYEHIQNEFKLSNYEGFTFRKKMFYNQLNMITKNKYRSLSNLYLLNDNLIGKYKFYKELDSFVVERDEVVRGTNLLISKFFLNMGIIPLLKVDKVVVFVIDNKLLKKDALKDDSNIIDVKKVDLLNNILDNRSKVDAFIKEHFESVVVTKKFHKIENLKRKGKLIYLKRSDIFKNYLSQNYLKNNEENIAYQIGWNQVCKSRVNIIRSNEKYETNLLITNILLQIKTLKLKKHFDLGMSHATIVLKNINSDDGSNFFIKKK